MANEFTRITHAASGTALQDINPNRSITDDQFNFCPTADGNAIPVKGYSKISFYREGSSSYNMTYKFYYPDGTSTQQSTVTLGNNSWCSDIDIPSGSEIMLCTYASAYLNTRISLKV